MAYTIINNFIPESLYPLKAPYTMIPEYVTIHNTANDATAINEAQYVHNNPAATSYHVAIDDKNAVQIIRFSRNGFHAGDGATGTGNRKSIGIEICYSKSGGQKYVDSEANAIEYIAHVLKQYRWGIDRVRWHRDWSGKNCPHRIFAEGRAQSVKNRIAARLTELNGSKIEQASKPVIKHAPAKSTSVSTSKVVAKPKENLVVDGYLGKATYSALQRYFGIYVDGIISRPSPVVNALQKLLGVKQDGYWGADTNRALQRRFGTYVDGAISRPSPMVKELQRRLNSGKL